MPSPLIVNPLHTSTAFFINTTHFSIPTVLLQQYIISGNHCRLQCRKKSFF